MLGLHYLRQGSGVTPDSGKTVLRSRLGLNYGQLPASELASRTCLPPISSANRIWRAAEASLAAETRVLNRRLSFRGYFGLSGNLAIGTCHAAAAEAGLAFDDRRSGSRAERFTRDQRVFSCFLTKDGFPMLAISAYMG